MDREVHNYKVLRDLELNKVAAIIRLQVNKLNVNVSKTKSVQFNKKRSSRRDFDIIYNSSKTASTSDTMFLGIILSNGCSWKWHVDYLCAKIDRKSVYRKLIDFRKLFGVY